MIAAAAVSLVLGISNDGWKNGWIGGASIILAITIVLVILTIESYSKQRQFQQLASKYDVCSARVIRDGKQQTVDSEELVVGDIIDITAGDTIPADCLAFETSTFFATNEADLTGEPESMPKNAVTLENYNSNPNPFLLKNTQAESGQAKAIVLAVGANTCFN